MSERLTGEQVAALAEAAERAMLDGDAERGELLELAPSTVAALCREVLRLRLVAAAALHRPLDAERQATGQRADRQRRRLGRRGAGRARGDTGRGGGGAAGGARGDRLAGRGATQGRGAGKLTDIESAFAGWTTAEVSGC